MDSLIIIAAAFVMDLLFGDPRWKYHPVRIIGRLISFLERIFYRSGFKRIAGLFLALIVIIISYFAAYFIIEVFSKIDPLAGAFVSVFLIYACLSIKDLKDESILVYRSLYDKDIASARKNLSMIVGRDTENLERPEIIRATVETIAEGTVDGIISPLFFAFLGGAPLCMAYKAVNTLDSMLGHRNARYKDFGWVSAKIDELLNYVPARLSAFLFLATGLVLRKDAVSIIRRVIRKMSFIFGPGSRIPQVSMAELLGVKLGGINYCGGEKRVVPAMGSKKELLSLNQIKQANKIMHIASFLSLLCGGLILWLIIK